MFRVALKMLFGDRGKYLGIVIGIALASVLMINQPGIMISILKTVNGLITDMSGPDLWVMDPMVKSVDDAKPMMDTQMYRVRGVKGVAWALPFYRGSQKVRMSNGETVQSVIQGMDDATLIGGPTKLLKGRLEDLRQPDSIIVDKAGAEGRLAKPSAIPGGKSTPLTVGDTLEINDKRAVVVGIAQATQTFASQPTIYTTYTRAKSYATSERKMMTYVLAKTQDGETPEAVARRITKETGLMALTSEEFKAKNLDFMINHTSIIVNFGFVVLVGFIVGAAVTGQIFYNFTLDNLRHFGVFKAMGTPDSVLRRMILLQALVVGFIGFGLGAGITGLFAYMKADSTDLSMTLNWQLLTASGGAVLFIVLMAALFSIRKVMKLEPAIVFKG
ncbi:ABC transporter permease [Holophaga foetida]|uniref:ABC transporter permease n=1 Tax=Holophaga foetida TaxID=35839 RepID=UPI0002474610|nr:ABC transporter permease [Holophaga foetida]